MLPNPSPNPSASGVGPPLWLLAELTYRCPLHCVFCYNPVDFAQPDEELSTDDWLRVLRQGRELGAVQCGLSGGEPLVRDDLEIIVAEARRLGYYTNLLTSGVGLTRRARRGTEGRRPRPRAAVVPGFHPRDERLPLAHQDLRAEEPRRADHQGARLADGDERGDPPPQHRPHRPHHRDGGRVRRRVPGAGEHAVLLVGLPQPRRSCCPRARSSSTPRPSPTPGARSWATACASSSSRPTTTRARPKKCVNGWGSMFLTITPDGTALPCHTAKMLPGLAFPNVREQSLARDLVRLRRLQPLPRHRLDEGAVRELRAHARTTWAAAAARPT